MGGGSLNNKNNASSKRYLVVLGIFALVIATTAASFAFYTYSRTGQTTTTITSGDISFTYEEGSDAYLTNAFPVNDDIGAKDTTGEYTFTVKMNSTSNANVIDYNVYLLDNNKDTNKKYFNNEQIKFALIKNGTFVAGTTSTTGKSLTDITGFAKGTYKGEGLVLENQEISSNQVDNYKLRIWISDDVNYSGNIDSSGTMTGTFNGYKYSLRVKVTSGSVVNQYVMGGYITDNDGNPLTDKTMVVYSNTPHYVKSDSEGYFIVEDLEDGEHELYYMGDKTIDELKSKTKDEIVSLSLSSSTFNTKSTSISFDNLKVNNFSLGRADKINVITLKDGKNENKKIATGESIQFKVNDVSNYTNIYSNNGSGLSYNNGTITVNNVNEDTNVVLSTGLGKSTSEMDKSKNYILMINDEHLTDSYECRGVPSGVCTYDKKITLNVNSKKITSSLQATIFSNENTELKITGDGYIGNDKSVDNTSTIIIKGSKLNISSKKANICNENKEETTSGLCLYGQYTINNLVGDNKSYTLLENISSNGQIVVRNGNAEINNINAYNKDNTVLHIGEGTKIVNVNGGYLKSVNGNIIYNGINNAVVNINDYLTYISSDNKIAIMNKGILNINASNADNCTNNYFDTTRGLCLYGYNGVTNYIDGIATINGGIYKTKIDTVYNRGDITINGGEYYSDNTKAFTVSDAQSSTTTYINGGYFESFNLGETINGTTYQNSWGSVAIEDNSTAHIKNAEIKGGYPIVLYNTATLNMCSGKLISTSGYDINKPGIFNYTPNVIFTNGTNTPNAKDADIKLNSNYSGTCSR